MSSSYNFFAKQSFFPFVFFLITKFTHQKHITSCALSSENFLISFVYQKCSPEKWKLSNSTPHKKNTSNINTFFHNSIAFFLFYPVMTPPGTLTLSPHIFMSYFMHKLSHKLFRLRPSMFFLLLKPPLVVNKTSNNFRLHLSFPNVKRL